jgi:hypothetical protein
MPSHRRIFSGTDNVCTAEVSPRKAAKNQTAQSFSDDVIFF